MNKIFRFNMNIEELENDFVGLSLDEFKKLNETLNYKYRVIRENGESFVVTMDFRTDRLNFTIEKGLITNISLG